MALQVGDIYCWGWNDHVPIATAVAGRLKSGAYFQDITLTDGRKLRAWEDFKYFVEVDQVDQVFA